MRIGLAGHSGFVGHAVASELQRLGHEIVRIARVPDHSLRQGMGAGPCRPENGQTEALARELKGLDLVINCAGRTVVRSVDPNDESYLANVLLPAYFYRQAVAAGVPRFVHIGSVAAIGSRTAPDAALSDQDRPSPNTTYGKSKLAGDERLLSIAKRSTALTVLRPPIIYGALARGVFGILRNAATYGVPLPIRGLRNRRSFMFVDNLASAIVAAAECELFGAYIVTDHRSMMPGELYDLMTSAAGKGKRSFTLPPTLVSLIAQLVLRGRSESLLGNAIYDDTRFRRDTGWEPPHSVDAAIEAVMAR